MKTRLALMVLVGVSVAIGSAWQSRSDETAAKTEADERLRAIKELLEQAINWYDLLPHAEAKVRLRPQVVMRWQNPVRTQTGAGLLAIWTDHGRPEAMASIFQWDDDICHEFGSLSRSNTLVGRDKTTVVWSPRNSGVDFRDVPGAPAAAGNPAARLRQMKAIAERFSARLPERADDGAEHEALRLLPTPLYRYEIKEANDTDPVLKDGGMFAFVMGTDPEVILLLEAVEGKDKVVWQYAFARATGWAAEAKLGDEVVWSVRSDTGRDPTSPQVQIRRPLP